MNGRTRGLVVAMAFFVATVTAGIWDDSGTPATPEASSCHVLAGRAGTLPCSRRSYPEDKYIRKFVGTTGTGCLLGLASGGVEGIGIGCLGGAASSIPW